MNNVSYLVSLEISTVKVNSHIANFVYCDPPAHSNKLDKFNGYPEHEALFCFIRE